MPDCSCRFDSAVTRRGMPVNPSSSRGWATAPSQLVLLGHDSRTHASRILHQTFHLPGAEWAFPEQHLAFLEHQPLFEVQSQRPENDFGRAEGCEYLRGEHQKSQLFAPGSLLGGFKAELSFKTSWFAGSRTANRAHENSLAMVSRAVCGLRKLRRLVGYSSQQSRRFGTHQCAAKAVFFRDYW